MRMRFDYVVPSEGQSLEWPMLITALLVLIFLFGAAIVC